MKNKMDLIIEKREEGQSVKDIARDLGLDVSYVYKVLKKANIVCNRKYGSRKDILSPLHEALGTLLRKERILNFEEQAGLFAKEINFSTQRLRFLEKGKYDPTLTDLIKIMKSMNLKFSIIDDLIKNLEEIPEEIPEE